MFIILESVYLTLLQVKGLIVTETERLKLDHQLHVCHLYTKTIQKDIDLMDQMLRREFTYVLKLDVYSPVEGWGVRGHSSSCLRLIIKGLSAVMHEREAAAVTPTNHSKRTWTFLHTSTQTQRLFQHTNRTFMPSTANGSRTPPSRS